mgnify:CR=1 FL=1
MMKSVRGGLLLAAAINLAAHADAYAYASEPIQIIVPFAPGGAADTLARKMAVYLQGRFRQSVIVENKLGTVIAAQELGRSKPEKAPIGPQKALLPIAMLVDIPQGIVVGSQLPVRNFKEFLTFTKASLGITFGTPEPTSETLLGFMDFLDRAGLERLATANSACNYALMRAQTNAMELAGIASNAEAVHGKPNSDVFFGLDPQGGSLANARVAVVESGALKAISLSDLK